MKNNLVLIVSIPVIIISYSFPIFSFFLLIVLSLFGVFILTMGVLKIFKWEDKNLFKIPVLIIGICLIGIIAGLFRPDNPATLESGNISKGLAYAYNTDRSDRKNIKFYIWGFRNLLEQRDSLRQLYVQRIINEKKDMSPTDKFHSAFILLNSNKISYLKTAYKFASEAASTHQLKEKFKVQWLKKAVSDRMEKITKCPIGNSSVNIKNMGTK